MKFLRFGVVDGYDESATAFERYPYDDESPFSYGFHGTVTGSGLHRCHRPYSFRGENRFLLSRIAWRPAKSFT